MNVIKTIDDELKERNYLDRFEKIRYIYLRTCKLFSYDIRWTYAKAMYADEFRTLLEEKKINLENVTDFDIVCHSYCKEILGILLKEILGVDISIKTTSYHCYAGFDENGMTWNMDATLSDLMKVKLHMPTDGFLPYGETFDYLSYLDIIDKKLGYFSGPLKKIEQGTEEDEIFNIVNSEIIRRNISKNFTDAFFYLEKSTSQTEFYDRRTILIRSMQDYYDKKMAVLFENKATDMYTIFEQDENKDYQIRRLTKNDYTEEIVKNKLHLKY